MLQSHKISFLIILSLLSLLPIFFIPGGALNVDVSKSVLLVLGTIAATLVFLLEIWKKKEVSIPWHPFVLVTLLLPLVYLLSAILSTPSALSLFGYIFEVGTFGYILLASVLLVLISLVANEPKRVLQVLVAFLASFSFIIIFSTIKILSGGSPVWGLFLGNIDSPIGRWTDLATALGLLSIFSILVLEMIPMKKLFRSLMYGVFGLSVILLAIVNFSTAFIFTLIFSVILFGYFSVIEKHFLGIVESGQSRRFTAFLLKPTLLPIILGVVSILFLINPTVSSTRGTLGETVTNFFNVANTEVRPSFSATLSISKAALAEDALLGSGPNTFSHNWLVYKPVNVNSTPFWGVAFPFGIGFIPTQIASTGILGTVMWMAFFVFLILLGWKALTKIPESGTLRFASVASFLASLYLWTASFMYAPSPVILALAFAFSGLFVAMSCRLDVIQSRVINFSRDVKTNFISRLLIVVLALGSFGLGFVAINKTLSVFYFQKAITLSNTVGVSLETIEAVLNKATKFSPADVHYVALSRTNFAKAQAVASDTGGTPEKNLPIFEEAISKSVEAARRAVDINPAGYENWLTLGMVYSSLVPKPLAVAGAYENAKLAYSEARKRNPLNPEIPLLLARLELDQNNIEAARSLMREAVVLKEDYAAAYLALAQLEIRENNLTGAITSAEKLSRLVPNNPAVYFELGVLKYSNKDYLGAIDALNSALALTPDYANAQYYLGLSLAQLGRLDKAREQFEAILITNPDSGEVQSIIKDLKAGKTVFLSK